MRLPILNLSVILALPPSLLLLFATQISTVAADARENQLPRQQRLPTAVKKMSLDEGEKFFPECHYAFAAEALLDPIPKPSLNSRLAASYLTPEEESLLLTNVTTAIPFRPPFPRHYDDRTSPTGWGGDSTESGFSGSMYRRARGALARLQGRQFSCPQDTSACDNIEQPDYCCPLGTTCFVVEGAPDAGNVGCCPEGNNCGGSVGSCPNDGSTACPADVGGGCCIPGFVCADVGCVTSTISIITQTTTTSTVVTTAGPNPTTQTQVVTVIITITPSAPPPETSTTSQTTTLSQSTAPTTTGEDDGGGLPPVRPTSSEGGITTDPPPTITTAPSPPPDTCPTGFYACIASAGSGCCRTGRDCSTTSCPPPALTTITTDGATVVVPVTDASAAAPADATPTCAGGWFLCGRDAGPVAGCCPSGYACGTASCTLQAPTATEVVQKELPGNGADRANGKGERDGGALRLVVVLLMFWLTW